MGMSAQDKMLYVANKLGLSSLKDMQGSTRVVYDSVGTAANVITLFEGSSQRGFPFTNLGANGNRFQVDEALLVEKVAFFIPNDATGVNYSGLIGNSVKFDLVIGNKTVIKDAVVEFAGQQAFTGTAGGVATSYMDLEGLGILIPPQVEFKVIAKPFVTTTRAASSVRLGCYLFGTAALLNFNTSI